MECKGGHGRGLQVCRGRAYPLEASHPGDIRRQHDGPDSLRVWGAHPQNAQPHRRAKPFVRTAPILVAVQCGNRFILYPERLRSVDDHPGADPVCRRGDATDGSNCPVMLF